MLLLMFWWRTVDSHLRSIVKFYVWLNPFNQFIRSHLINYGSLMFRPISEAPRPAFSWNAFTQMTYILWARTHTHKHTLGGFQSTCIDCGSSWAALLNEPQCTNVVEPPQAASTYKTYWAKWPVAQAHWGHLHYSILHPISAYIQCEHAQLYHYFLNWKRVAHADAVVCNSVKLSHILIFHPALFSWLHCWDTICLCSHLGLMSILSINSHFNMNAHVSTQHLWDSNSLIGFSFLKKSIFVKWLW